MRVQKDYQKQKFSLSIRKKERKNQKDLTEVEKEYNKDL